MTMVQFVGIVNVTPDSFSDGGEFFSPEAAVKQAEQLFADGASIVDIGAESTRPNATRLSAEQEWERLEPVLKILLPMYAGKISLDSYHPENIERAFKIGPVIVNDVTGMNNPAMVAVVSKLKPTVIISHLPGVDIQEAHSQAPVSSSEIVKKDLLAKAKLLEKNGLKPEQIILDPGIGFGKTMDLNFQLLSFAKEVPGYRVMIGYSRKRFLGEDRMNLEPNLEAGKIAIASGSAYLRLHDVAGHRQLLR
jgi:dihydropteroate synthase